MCADKGDDALLTITIDIISNSVTSVKPYRKNCFDVSSFRRNGTAILVRLMRHSGGRCYEEEWKVTSRASSPFRKPAEKVREHHRLLRTFFEQVLGGKR